MKNIKDFLDDENDKSRLDDLSAKEERISNNKINDSLPEEEEEDDDDTIEITVDLDIPNDEDLEDEEDLDESELNERKIRQTRKMKNSAKVVRETTEELFGKDGIARPLADKVFKIFKRELRKKSKDLGVPISQVRQWKITLRDYDNPKEGKTVAGKSPRK